MGNRRNRNLGSMDGFAREEGDRIYRHGTNEQICQHMYQSNGQCSHYLQDITEALTEIDLSEVPESSYNPGENIQGYLDELGWVII